jgi:hypothetical protein
MITDPGRDRNIAITILLASDLVVHGNAHAQRESSRGDPAREAGARGAS